MGKPDHSGEILRAIARSYRDEVGPARAEQLVNRAMARASAPSPRFRAIGVLAASGALAVSVLAVGVVLLSGNSDPGPASDPATPVASAPIPEESNPENETVAAPILPTAELQQALNLIEQQRQREAAEVVVRALSSIMVSVVDAEIPAEVSSTTAPEEETRPNPSSAVGVVPPEQSTYPQDRPPEAGSGSSETDTAQNEGSSQESASQPATPDPQPTIEELGEVLKVEVEELLSADPQDLDEAAKDAREAAQQIQDHRGEPTILLPSDGDDE